MRRNLIEAAPRANPVPESEAEVQITEYLEMLRRHWRLLLATGVLGLAGGLLHFFNTEPSYTARTRILIERRNPLPLQGDTTWLAPWWNPEFYPTQYEILRSQGVATFVVERLRLWEDPNLQREHGGRSAEADEAYKVGLAGRVRGGLEIKEVKGTQLVDILFRGNNPDLAQRIANGYAAAFIEYGKEERRRSATDASGFLTAEIESLKAEIADKESILQQYSRATDLVSNESSTNPLQQRIEGLNREYVTARARRIEAEARYNEAVNGNREALASSHAGSVVNEVRSELIRKEREYETKLKTFKPDFPEMESLRAEIEQTRNRLEKLVLETAQGAIDDARADFQTARRSQEALERELAKVRSESIDMSSSAAEYNNLRSEITNRRSLLDELLKRQSETDVAVRGSDQATVRQIDAAGRPGAPSNPKLQRSLGRGFALGIGLGLAIALLFEFLDRTVKTAEELERRLGLPVLAVIPDVSNSNARGGVYGQFYGRVRRGGGRSSRPRKASKKGESIDIDLVPHARPKLAVSEAYRSLRTALLLSSAEELRTVVITSATAGEGKTATSCNLAVVLAQLGKRVLLIDADTRKPRVHQVFRISNRIGLVNFLVGRNELHEALIQSAVPSLFLCPAGPAPPNPSELISSERMRYLLREVGKQFDVVVLDSPPTLAVTDSTLLGSMADGVVVCVRASTISRDEVRICRDRLALAGVRLLGSVLNAHRPLTSGYYRGYTYHYESYGDPGRTTSETAVA